MNVRVSADSTCDLSQEILEQYDIGIVPLYIILGEKTCRDGIDCTKQDLYDFAEKTGRLGSTAAVPIADYYEYFQQRLETLRPAGTFHHFLGHVRLLPERLRGGGHAGRAGVCGGRRNLSTGIGHLAMDAVELARAGKDGGEIQAVLNEKKAKLNVSFVLDTLKYLYKGGRCSGVAALGANLLNLKPCIEVHDGAMGVGKKYRGALKKTFEAYIRDRLEGRDDIDYHRIFITDSGVDRELIRELMDLIRSLGPFEEIWNTQAGCTIANHCGPNCMGILYYNK